jgi:hypothetical protein
MSGDMDRDTDVDTDHQAGDDFHVEVSDLRASGVATSAAPSPLARLTLRQRYSRLTITLCGALVALAIIWSAGAALHNGHPTPPAALTATALPNSDRIYLLPNPPGVVVSLDGHPLAHLPLTSGSPLRLSRGSHRLVWTSTLLPFHQTECRISVPRASQDTCPAEPLQALPQELRALPGSIVGLHASLAMLGPGDASSLTQAIQDALDASRSTATLQPGEYYLGAGTSPVLTHQPLRATLTYQLDASATPLNAGGYSEPCIIAEPSIPCRFPGQDCTQLCTLDSPPASLALAPDEWVVGALVSATWDYTTQDGQIVASGLHENFGQQLALLRITWDGAVWHVTPIFGHTPGLDAADDPACDPARVWLDQSSVWSFMMVDPPPGSQVRFASDANPADGCVASLNQAPGNLQPALFLERFGVLLTLNDMARDTLDNFPAADPTEQALAAKLIAQLQP